MALKLRDMLYREIWRDESKGGKQHGDIGVFLEHSPNEIKVKAGSLGIGYHKKGYALMWDKLRKVSTHEAGHLIGIPGNHDSSGMIPNFNIYKAAGYSDSGCVMNWDVPSGRFCDECLDRLIGYWQGVEDNHRIRFFK